ncbi:MAG: DNA-processing protein DprA [Candidatus Paceibacterota bacterium]
MVWSKKFQTALYSIDGVGPATFHKILKALTKHEVTESEFWVNKAQIWHEIALDKRIVESIRKFKKEHNIDSYYERLLAKDIRVALKNDSEFPSLLGQLDQPPPLLFIRGSIITNQESFIGVVGTRSITEYGRRVITEFIPPLIQFGKTIVSGFMYGVDAIAQRAALQAKGKTVGVLGFGFDFMYPPEHQALFEYFLSQGATFLSPFAPHVPARPGNFPARNAVVAGMSEGVLVIEGAADSGSLITAHCAAEFGREVWAVPGSIFNEFSAGTQILINEGAQLVRSAADVLGISPATKDRQNLRRAWEVFSGLKRAICERLDLEALPVDQLATKLGCRLSELAVTLVELELLGLVEQVGNKWQLAV